MRSIVFLIVCFFALSALPAQATLLSVSGPNSLRGAAAAIIAPPPDVTDGAASDEGQEGFNEAQNVLLASNVTVDGGTILAGTTVSSHMIFLNNSVAEGNTLNTHIGVQWTFDGNVLGVMSDFTGSEEVATESLFGAAGTVYPAAAFDARGIESDDSYSFSGAVLTFNSRIRQPGDWIRVLTAGTSNTVPEPATAILIGSGLLGLFGVRRARKAI